MFEIKLCKTKAALSVKPVKQVKLDVTRLARNFTVLAASPVAAVLSVGSEDVVVHQYGEIFFKTLKDEQAIRKIADDIYKASVIP